MSLHVFHLFTHWFMPVHSYCSRHAFTNLEINQQNVLLLQRNGLQGTSTASEIQFVNC